MRFLMYSNPASPEAAALSEQLRQRLIQQGQQLCAMEAAEQADMAIVLGGDGTVLRAVRALRPASKPIWAVNCGHLGYLTDCPREQAFSALDRILAGEYHMERRIQLGGSLLDGARVYALNEFLLHRSACSHVLQVEVLVNGCLALRFRGDGLILCTPSGSTAYNLSAGGPVLMPEMELIAMTPICAQSLSVAPIVISARDRVRVSWHMQGEERQLEHPDLTADGQEKYRLPMDGALELNGDISPVALVRTQSNDFYGRLQHRMHWNAE